MDNTTIESENKNYIHKECSIDKRLDITWDEYGNNVILSRCCYTHPFAQFSISDFLKLDDIIKFSCEERHYDIKEAAKECISTCNIKPEIKVVNVGLSRVCNLRCYHCYLDGHHRDTPLMKKTYFDTLYKIKGHQLDKISLTDNGEPFIYYNEIILYLMSLSTNDTKQVEITTNLTLLDEKRIKTLQKISNQTNIKYTFIVSLDGISKKTFEATRIGASWEKVTRNLRYLTKYFKYEDIKVSYVIRKPALVDAPFAKSFFIKNFGLKTDIYYDFYDEDCKKYFLDLKNFEFPMVGNFLNLLFKDKNTIYYSKCCSLERNEIKTDDFFKLKSFNELPFSRKKLQYSNCDYLCDRCFEEIKSIDLSCCTACNLHCYNCVKKDCDFINCEELNNSDTLFKVLNFLKNKGLDSLSFDANGEIFIHYYRLIDFLSELSTNNFKKLSFITNGTLLDVERIYRLKQISYQTGIGYNFIVSLDGCTKETYEATRPGANFEKVIETIHNLLKYFNVEIIFTVKKTNLQDVNKIESFIAKTFNNKIFNVSKVYDHLDNDILNMHEKGEI